MSEIDPRDRAALLQARDRLAHQLELLRNSRLSGQGDVRQRLMAALREAERELEELGEPAIALPLRAEALAVPEARRIGAAPSASGAAAPPGARRWRPPVWPTVVGLAMLGALGAWLIASAR